MKRYLHLIYLLITFNSFGQFGDVDVTFNPGTSTNDLIYDIAIRPDGKILVAGQFTIYQGQTAKGIVLLNQNGSIDASFVSPFNSYGGNLYVSRIKVLSDGKAYITGADDTSVFLNRINSDGSIDPNFSATLDNSVFDILPESDGKLTIVGRFSMVGGVPRKGIARIHNNGLVDATFYPGSGIADGESINSVEKQSNGKYIIGGLFSHYDVHSPMNLARLNDNGSYDTPIGTATGGGTQGIWDINILDNDKIIISGKFSEINGTSVKYIARLNPDTTLDTTFLANITTPFSGTTIRHVILPDNQIIVYNSEYPMSFPGAINRNYIAKLNNRGVICPEFDPGTSFASTSGFSIIVNKVIALPTGRLLAAGSFESYNGASTKNIVKIDNSFIQPQSSFCHYITDRLTGASSMNPLGVVGFNTGGDDSTCDVIRLFPGYDSLTTNCYFNTHTFTNNSSNLQCVTFNLQNQDTINPLVLSVYATSFNPADLAQNYIGGAEYASYTNANFGMIPVGCSIQIPAGTTIIVVVSSTLINFHAPVADYILTVDGLCNYPTVTVKALPCFNYSTTKPVIYYSASFNMPISGFTESDIIVDTDTGNHVVAFIKNDGLGTNNKDFIIGLSGMEEEGYVDVKIPAGAVFSGDEGTNNLTSINYSNSQTHSNSQTTYLKPIFSCTKPGSEGILNVINDVQIYSSATGCQLTDNTYINYGIYYSRIHSFINSSGSTKTIGLKIKRPGISPHSFNVFKDAIPTATDIATYLNNWIGGYDGAITTIEGFTYNASYFTVEAGQSFHIQVFTEGTDYEVILTDMDCTELLTNEDFAIESSPAIYPNPSNGIFNIASDVAVDTICVYNSLGQKILETNNSQFDLTQHSKGIYFVQIETESKKSTYKIILH